MFYPDLVCNIHDLPDRLVGEVGNNLEELIIYSLYRPHVHVGLELLVVPDYPDAGIAMEPTFVFRLLGKLCIIKAGLVHA